MIHNKSYRGIYACDSECPLEIRCRSDETLPTEGIPEGSVAWQYDIDKILVFDGKLKVWYEPGNAPS